MTDNPMCPHFDLINSPVLSGLPSPSPPPSLPHSSCLGLSPQQSWHLPGPPFHFITPISSSTVLSLSLRSNSAHTILIKILHWLPRTSSQPANSLAWKVIPFRTQPPASPLCLCPSHRWSTTRSPQLPTVPGKPKALSHHVTLYMLFQLSVTLVR